MQTFLPYPDFVASARALDAARLGKQRVEALQVLRAIVLPSYGWQNHPAMQMWRGYVPALTRYGLDMVDEWTRQGHADTTRPLIAEFAPEAAAGIAKLAVPSWLGDEQLHRRHRSNLLRKAPEFYGPLFPGVPDDLPYVWPGPDPVNASGARGGAGLATSAGLSSPIWILRPRTAEEFDEWLAGEAITLGELSPRGTRSPKWMAQRAAFSALPPGTPVAVLTPDGGSLKRGTVTAPVITVEEDNGLRTLLLAVQFRGEVARQDFAYPALLQDPRTVFSV